MESIEAIRTELNKNGVRSLTSSKLQVSDLSAMNWCGDALHLDHVKRQLESTHRSDTLAIRTENGTVVAKGFVDHEFSETESLIAQLASHPELQCLGIGTLLMSSLEGSAKSQNKKAAVLGVEKSNVRAANLYSRLGYIFRHEEQQSWDSIDANGDSFYYQTDVLIMAKALS